MALRHVEQMKMGFCAKIQSTVLLGLLVYTIMSCGTNTPLAEYTPSSDQEAALKNVLLGFEDGVNRRDVKKVAGFIHEDATLILGRERSRLSKSDYLKILPQRLADQPPIALGRPKMALSGNAADVRIYMTRGDARMLVTFHLTRDEHRWAISGWTY
jgi:hypothetical protein